MGSFGAVLRRTREEKGISLDEIAGETRLSKRYLLALEDEAIHKLPGGTYNRAYLRSYAGYLGLDIDRLVRDYSLEEAHQTETGRLKPQPDVLASIGKAVESRQTSTSAGRSWTLNGNLNWDWNWAVGRERRIALYGGLGLLALVLLTGLLWIGLRGFREDAVVAGAVGPSAPATAVETAPPPPARASAVPTDEAPEPSRGAEPPPAPLKSEAGKAATPEPRVPAAAPPVALVPKPAAPAPEKAAALSRAAAAGPAKGRTTRTTRGRLSVTGSGVGSKVVDKRLVGEADTFALNTRVTFWTRIAGGRPGDTVSHVWFHNGVRIGSTSLRVGSSDWRTQSRQLLTPDGQWAVEVRDADGRVLARHSFRAEKR
jgi:cytoskeleton protein RodZ